MFENPFNQIQTGLGNLGRFAAFRESQRQAAAENQRANAYLTLAQLQNQRAQKQFETEQSLLPYKLLQVKYDAVQSILPSVTQRNYPELYKWLVEDNVNGGGSLPQWAIPSPEDMSKLPPDEFKKRISEFGLSSAERAKMDTAAMARDLEREKLAFGREELSTRKQLAQMEYVQKLMEGPKEDLSDLEKKYREFQATHEWFKGGQEDYVAIMEEAKFNPLKAAMDLATKSTIAQFDPQKVPTLANDVLKWWAQSGMEKAYIAYKTKEEVKADYESGKLTLDQATDILKKRFGAR